MRRIQQISRVTLFGRTNSTSTTSFFAGVPLGPPDAILGLTEAWRNDPNPNKINLGVGAYRDADGKPYVLEVVREAERRIQEQHLNHEYAGITGLPDFSVSASKYLLGADSPAIAEKRLVNSQTISGTGALRVALTFLGRYHAAPVLLPDPTWANHFPLITDSGLKPQTYRYYSNEKNALDMDGWIEDLEKAQDGSIVLMHACAHNPTGMDPTRDEWKRVSETIHKKGHYVFFDCAYQGFASGDPARDAWAVRYFESQGHPMMITQSFAKNMGLYGERVGNLNIVCGSPEEAERVMSQVKIIIRAMYSNPPIFGARVASTILNDPELANKWEDEVKGMAGRIDDMRTALVDGLAKCGSTRDWSHIKKQIGMFCYSGLTGEQVDRLKNEHSIYMTRNGRISMAGVTPANVGPLASAMHAVSKTD